MNRPLSPLAPLETPHQRRLTPLRHLAADQLLVHEIYASIQGESTRAGLPCSFVRLTGCRLRCRWCDTAHAFAGGAPMSVDDVLAAVAALPPKMVELTGGEPLDQPLALALLRGLADAGFEVLLETGGALPIDQVDPRVIIILDVKCPASEEMAANDWTNLDRLRPRDEVKFVIADRVDFDWALDLVRQRGLLRWPVLFSPVFGELPPAQLADWLTKTGLPIRLQLQQHKYIWEPTARGV